MGRGSKDKWAAAPRAKRKRSTPQARDEADTVQSILLARWPSVNIVQNLSMDATKPTYTGGCYCGAVRYQCEGPILMRGQCLCLTCQKISGGAGNLFMAVSADGFQFTKGTPSSFNKQDRPGSPTRHFCAVCGVHLTARSERAPGGILIKVGTLDDPSVFEGPQLVTWTSEMQKFHLLPADVPAHPEFPRPNA